MKPHPRLKKDHLYSGPMSGFFVRYEWHVEAFIPHHARSNYTIFGGEHRTLRSARKQLREENARIHRKNLSQRLRIRRVLVVMGGVVY